MPLKVVKKDEKIEVKNVTVLIYGQPGVGKTSTGFTCENSLLLDCDQGAYRSAFRKDTVPVTAWADIAVINDEDLAPYKTIVVDTVGRLLDFLASDIIQANPKHGYNGALSLQGYGQLKARFTEWTKRLKTMGIDIVLIAHDKEDKRGDETVVRPDIQGGSYGEVFKVADSVGYMYMSEKGKTIDFNPTVKWEGKNVAQLEPMIIPDFKIAPDFFAGILAEIKASMNKLSEEGMMIASVVDAERDAIGKSASATALNKCLDHSKTLIEGAQLAVKRLIWEQAKRVGVPFDKELDKFVPPAKEDMPEVESEDDPNQYEMDEND